jgi:WD40 repeat protein
VVKVWATEDGAELAAFGGKAKVGGSSTGGGGSGSSSGGGGGGDGVGGKVWSVAWGADESFLVSGCVDGTAVVWSVPSPR